MQIHTERHGKKSMTGNIDSKIQKEQTRHLCSSLLTGMKNAHLADHAPFVCVCMCVCMREKKGRDCPQVILFCLVQKYIPVVAIEFPGL